MAYAVTINGVDRTGDIIVKTIHIQEYVDNQSNTCDFVIRDPNSLGFPVYNQEISITLDGDTIFGGLIDRVRREKWGIGEVRATVECVDYTRILDTKLVHEVYENMTDREVAVALLNDFAAGLGISDVGIQGSTHIDQIVFNYIPLSQAFKKLAQYTGNRWYIDYDKVLRYHPISTYPAPFNITDSTTDYWAFAVTADGSQIKNRIYVKGGNRASDLVNYLEKGDGSKKKFVLPDKPHDVTVFVNGVEKTLGIFSIDTGKQWYLNFQEKYLVQDDSETTLTDTDELEVTYRYDIPILISQNNDASIAELGGDPVGIREFAIFDKGITSHQAARARASQELSEYSSSVVEGGFKTYTNGFHAGQYININLTEYGINDDYIVQQINAQSLGGGRYEYNIKIASAKTLGIIGFLINLMVTDQDQIGFDTNEAVDEYLSVTLDSLNSDSLLDSIDIDSAGPYRTWATDTDTSPTRARWNLFTWK